MECRVETGSNSFKIIIYLHYLYYCSRYHKNTLFNRGYLNIINQLSDKETMCPMGVVTEQQSLCHSQTDLVEKIDEGAYQD